MRNYLEGVHFTMNYGWLMSFYGWSEAYDFTFQFSTKRVFTWYFISSETKYFQFGVWSILRNETHCAGVTSFRQKWNFISGDQCYVNTTPKWNHSKGNICACKYFIKTKIVVQKIKTKKNFISFRPPDKVV